MKNSDVKMWKSWHKEYKKEYICTTEKKCIEILLVIMYNKGSINKFKEDFINEGKVQKSAFENKR